MVKKVGTALYVHKSNLRELIDKYIPREDLRYIKDAFYKELELQYTIKTPIPDIIKYDTRNHNLTFIHCPTWDNFYEPIVGDAICIHPDGTYKITKGGSKVYHHKWMFVSDDYKGFDVAKMKERSKQIEAIPNIKSVKSRIGNLNFWEKFCKENGLESNYEFCN